MRVGELSERTGLPVGTIKFYLRSGVIPPGTSTATNQAQYSEEHLHRLRLVRAMAEVGGLSLNAITEVLAAADDDSIALHDAFGLAQDAMVAVEAQGGSEWAEASADLDALIGQMGWCVRPQARARHLVISAIVTLRRFGWPITAASFEQVAAWLSDNAAEEIGFIDPADRTGAIETSVIGTVVIEQVMVGLRRLALEHHSSTRFADPVSEPPEGEGSAGEGSAGGARPRGPRRSGTQ